MNRELKKGLTLGLIIYSLGILATTVVHLIFGWSNPHTLPPAIVPVVVTLFVAALRVVISGFNLVTRKSEAAKGELIVHACAGFLIVVIISMMRMKS